MHGEEQVKRDKTYTLFELADRAGMQVSELQTLIERKEIDSHITDDTEVVNRKDFLQWREQRKDKGQRHYQ